MNITREKIGACRWKVTVEVPAERVQANYEGALKVAMLNAEVDGFRPGRAPRALVENKYAKVILDELKDTLLREAYQEAVKQEKLKVVNIVDVDQPAILIGQPMRIVFTVDLVPEFELPEYKNIPVKSQPVEVKPEEIDAVKKDCLRSLEQWVKVEGRPAQSGDLVVVDYEGFCEGKPITEMGIRVPLLGKAKEFAVVTDDTMWLPNLGPALIGAQVGERKEVWIEFPQDFHETVLAGKKCAYFVEIKAIHEKKVSPPDAEFYAKYGVASDAELEEKIRVGLRKSKEDWDRQQQKNQIYEYLLRGAEMELPESEVNEEVNAAARQQIQELLAGGRQPQLSEQERDELVKRSTALGMVRVKLRHILRRIAETENIEVKPDEVRFAIRSIVLSEGGTMKDAEKLAEKPDAYEKVEEMVRSKKVMDWLLAQAKVETVATEEKKP